MRKKSEFFLEKVSGSRFEFIIESFNLKANRPVNYFDFNYYYFSNS